MISQSWVGQAVPGPYLSWTPSWTNLTVGNGTLNYAKYIQIGKTVHFRVRFTFGSTTSVSGLIGFSIPINLHADYAAVTDTISMTGQLNDATGSRWVPYVTWGSSSRLDVYTLLAGDTLGTTSSTAPFTWTTSDQIMVLGTYEGV